MEKTEVRELTEERVREIVREEISKRDAEVTEFMKGTMPLKFNPQ